ncbi:MAG TPA: VOC family protein [Pedobacter sp.]|uniref:VOC family protein n=1 Tax=Pedobacter sp. TaxID=1411316 RepID=UPI002B5945A6|nr:VOC family protein [Pedobacter sp.]HMI05195.1 VOC family protein [Pedobacter sp.]
MKKTILVAMLFTGIGFTACRNAPNANSQTEKANKTANQTKNNMKNLASIIEIPVTDLSRAIAFYQTILEVSIEEMEMDGVQMGVLPSDGETVNVVLAKGNDYKPATDGAVVYLNAGNDLQSALDKIEQNGGKIIVPKTIISPEMGYFALFIDTEGNKLGLHSKN